MCRLTRHVPEVIREWLRYLVGCGRGGPDFNAELLELNSYRRRPDPSRQPVAFVACFKSRDEIFRIEDRPEEGRRDTDIYREHDCPEFAQYEPGYAPRAFQDLMMQKWLEEREDRRDRDMREGEDRRTRRMIYAVLVASALSGGITALATYLAR